MALPSPGTTWKLIRFLLREAPAAVPAALAYLETQLDANESSGDVNWMRWVVVCQRSTPAGTSEDKVQFKLDVVNITGGAIDTTWTAGDFTTCKNAFDTYLAAIKASFSSNFSFVQYRAYQMGFNPTDPGPGARSRGAGWAFAATGPPRYVLDFSTPCTGSGNAPYQVALTVTLKTGWPRHWGRIYLPTPADVAFTGSGRVAATTRTTLANATKALGSTLSDAEFLPVVPVTDLNKSAFHALLGINQYVVDDVPDVQRRRRARQASARTIGV